MRNKVLGQTLKDLILVNVLENEYTNLNKQLNHTK